MTQLPTEEDIQIGSVQNSMALRLKQNFNCWICEGWTEQHFMIDLSQLERTIDSCENLKVKLHLEIDEYEGDTMTKVSMFGKEYEIYRMLPAGSVRYYYSIDGQPIINKN